MIKVLNKNSKLRNFTFGTVVEDLIRGIYKS